jgi:predicted nucleic acid-binding Zn ribbon protein
MQWDSDFKGPVRLRGVLGGLSNIKGWQKRFSRAGLWKVWEDVVGPKISDHAWPERFQEVDTLVIVVSDSIWMQELSFQRTRNWLVCDSNWGMSPRSVLIGPPAAPVTGRRKEARAGMASRPMMPTELRTPLSGNSRTMRCGRP